MLPALEWRAKVQHITEMSPAIGQDTAERTLPPSANESRYCQLAMLMAILDNFPIVGGSGHQGDRLPVRGRISMDQCAVGIPAELDLLVGDELTIFGPPQSGAPDANQLGEIIGTIGYEIVSRLSRRIPVDYI